MTALTQDPGRPPPDLPKSATPIRVLIIDDSALVRELLSGLLEVDGDIRVVGTAADPYIARRLIKELNPDVLTLDVEMPRMDGISFLRNLMRLRPMPVVMISAHTQGGAEITLEALALGAVDFVAKPSQDLSIRLGDFAAEIRAKVRGAAASRVRRLALAGGNRPAVHGITESGVDAAHRLIVLGASAGGTEAIREAIAALPVTAPPVLICQHLPALFTRLFAQRLDGVGPLRAHEAADGDRVEPGHVYVAPGDRHLHVRLSGDQLLCRLDDGPAVNRHKPAVDVLFESAARLTGYSVRAALLTGMGRDGASGLLSLRRAGARTVAQDEATSLVWGMPGAAVKLGAADQILPLSEIPRWLLS
jgi:two-component system, chemotaxis family, protein-glutamate methylesterase/glutaminase